MSEQEPRMGVMERVAQMYKRVFGESRSAEADKPEMTAAEEAWDLAKTVLYAVAIAWAVFGWSFMAGQQMRLIGLAGPRALRAKGAQRAAAFSG